MVKKRAGTGVLTYIILMFSLVISIGSIYFFTLHNPINSRDESFKYTTISDNEQVIEDLERKEGFTFVEAILDLKKEGCHIVYVKDKMSLNDPNNINFNEFKSKALVTKTVVVTPSDSGNLLLVQIKKEQWVWTPS